MLEEFWKTTCELMQFYRIVFYLSVTILSLAVVSLAGIRSGTASYYIAFLTIGINAPIAFCSGYLIRKCVNQRAQQ